MPSYRYTAVDRQGRLLRARLEAQTPEEARRLLRSRGETLLKLRAGRRPGSSLRMPLWGRPKDRELSLFCRQFRSLLRAGVPMLEA
ncbi:MAG: type II secretion system F family protein, partial [Oscillospiraceae bacterium]|nr:type II secretion system F family protein [Oscillospiraceae bacterium]